MLPFIILFISDDMLFQSPVDLSGGDVQAAGPWLLVPPVPRLPPDRAAASAGHLTSQSAEQL